jgi:hypothetical protein
VEDGLSRIQLSGGACCTAGPRVMAEQSEVTGAEEWPSSKVAFIPRPSYDTIL